MRLCDIESVNILPYKRNKCIYPHASSRQRAICAQRQSDCSRQDHDPKKAMTEQESELSRYRRLRRRRRKAMKELDQSRDQLPTTTTKCNSASQSSIHSNNEFEKWNLMRINEVVVREEEYLGKVLVDARIARRQQPQQLSQHSRTNTKQQPFETPPSINDASLIRETGGA
jgi:hypothetical protein